MAPDAITLNSSWKVRSSVPHLPVSRVRSTSRALGSRCKSHFAQRKLRVTCAKEPESTKNTPDSTSTVESGKKFAVDQMRAGARRPIEAADALQKVQQEKPEILAAIFSVLCILSAASLINDVLKVL